MRVSERTESVRWLRQSGFTLLELMVVLVILGTIVGLGSTAYRSFEQQATADLARVEMKRIAGAVQRLQQDVGYFPGFGRFAIDGNSTNLDWLFHQPASLPRWDVSRRRGWHGPYIAAGDEEHVATSAIVCGQTQLSDKPADEDPFALAFDAQHSAGLSDTFARLSDETTATVDQLCFARWQQGRWRRHSPSGQPYHYLRDFFASGHPLCPDSQHNCIVLQSFGPDGRNNNGQGDDLILVIRQNMITATGSPSGEN